MYCFLHSGVMCVARWSENFISALCRMCSTASGVGGVDVSSRFVYLFSALNLLLPSPAVQLNCFLLYCRRFALRTITHDDLYQLACRAAAQFRHTNATWTSYSSRRLWKTLECPSGIDYRALRTITEPNEGQCHVTELALSLSANARSVINYLIMPTNYCVNDFCRNFLSPIAQLIMYCRSELVINDLRAPAADDNSSPITIYFVLEQWIGHWIW